MPIVGLVEPRNPRAFRKDLSKCQDQGDQITAVQRAVGNLLQCEFWLPNAVEV